MIQSSLYVEGRVEGRAEGRVEGQAQGRLQNARQICAAIVREQYPAIAERAQPMIAACSDSTRLEQWTLAALKLDEVRFLKLLGLTSSPKATRARRRSRGRR